MAKKELIATAQSLGLEIKGLNVAQLEKAIADNKSADATETASTDAVDTGDASSDTADTNDTETTTKSLEKLAEEAQVNADTKKVEYEKAQALADEAKSKLANVAEHDAKEKELSTGFSFGGKTYGLSDLTPKTLKVLDTVYSQEELLQNKDAMEFLIVGNSCFVKRLK
jgi:hypothetical protein